MLLYVLNLSDKKKSNVIRKISAHNILSDINNTQNKDPDTSKYITRSYHSSDWEKLWLNNIHKWQYNGICEALLEQKEQIGIFMNSTCSAHTDTDWCLIDDSVHQFWYNTIDSRIQLEKPLEIRYVSAIKAIFPDNKKIWSWFEVENKLTGQVKYEYIEPLVSHLRHPLARCHFADKNDILLVDRSYVLPGFDKSRKSYLFDAGASSWNSGAGGPSLSYFTSVWKRYGIDWNHIEAWEGLTDSSEFYKTVPTEWLSKVSYHKEWISTSPTQPPFVPSIIESRTNINDYVVFKLDIDSKFVESEIVKYMMHWDKLQLIDEFLWEHHVDNYLMASNWGSSQDMTKKISDSYEYFLFLRHKGVRAHSWV